MTFRKFAPLIILTILLQGFIDAQEWTSYQSPNQVNDLVDTGDELLLATDEGLVVIDKSTLARTTFNKSNSNLVNDHIQAITEGQNGSIWIGTYDVIMMQFDGSDFQNATAPISDALGPNTQMYDLKIAPNGDFWVGTTDGVFHREGQTWSHYDTTEFGPRFFEAWDIEVQDDGEVFVAGIDLHHLVNGEWVNIIAGTNLEGYLNADLFTSSDGNLYFAGDLDKIGRFDGQQWQEYPIDFNGSQVVRFSEDTDGNVYFNTRQDGIFKLENDNWVQQEGLQSTTFNNQTNYFHIDDQNRRWMNKNIHLSVNDGGDVRSTLIADHTLESNGVNIVHKGENGKLYFITNSEENFSVLDTDGNWSFLPKPPSAMRFEFMNDLLVLADDNIWLATNSGLFQYNGSEWVFTALERCAAIDVDSQGKIYIRSNNKIYIMDNGAISEYNAGNSSLTTLLISGHGIDAEDNLWIASGEFDVDNNVIQKVTPAGEWTTFSATDHPVINRPEGDFVFDNDGNVWIVEGAFGALKFDGTSWTDPVRETNGELETRSFNSITTDENGRLYFAFDLGISTLENGEWKNFINEEVAPRTSSDATIAFDDEGTLWWANRRSGLFSFMPEPTTSSTSPSESAAATAGLKLYPNPALTYTTIDFITQGNAKVQVAIYNQMGQLTSEIDLGQLPEGTHQQEINLDRLPKGFYTVQLRINNSSSTRKLIVQ